MNCNAPLQSPRLLRLHAENAAFLGHRLRQVREAHNCRLADVYDLERRLSGHLDALLYAGRAGRDMAGQIRQETPGWGETFVAAWVGLQSDAAASPAALLADDPDGIAIPAVAAAAAACPPPVVAGRIRRWIAGADPALTRIALAACSARRADPGDRLRDLCAHREPAVAAAALRLAGQTGRADLLPLALSALAAPEAPATAHAAAWAATLLGDRARAPAALARTIGPETPPALCRAAAELFAHGMDDGEARATIGRLMGDPSTQRWAIVACGVFGAADSLDWLIGRMDEPALARAAGRAFCTITGAGISAESLELAEFPAAEDDPAIASDPDEAAEEAATYWPDPEKMRDWLDRRRDRFSGRGRMLLGMANWAQAAPYETAARSQADYRALSVEMAMRAPEAPLPNWRAPVRMTDRGFTRAW